MEDEETVVTTIEDDTIVTTAEEDNIATTAEEDDVQTAEDNANIATSEDKVATAEDGDRIESTEGEKVAETDDNDKKVEMTESRFNKKFEPLKLFVGGLREETEDRDLEDHFEEYGRITRAMVMKNSYGSRRFGFVTFEEQDSLEKALEKAPHMINKKLVEVKRAVPEGKINPRTEAGCRIFVGGLSEEIKEVDLHQALLKAGYEEEDILEVSVMTVSGSLEHRGFGFISLSTPEKAAELVEKKQLKVKDQFADVALALRKDEMKARKRYRDYMDMDEEEEYRSSRDRDRYREYERHRAMEWYHEQDRFRSRDRERERRDMGHYYDHMDDRHRDRYEEYLERYYEERARLASFYRGSYGGGRDDRYDYSPSHDDPRFPSGPSRSRDPYGRDPYQSYGRR